MKKLFISILALLSMSLTALCNDQCRTFNAKVTTGTLAVTNDASDNYQITAVAFQHSAQCTNTFTITRIRPIIINSNVTTVTTNAPLMTNYGSLKDFITTNTVNMKSVYFVTNIMFSASTTNDTNTLVYGEYDLKEGWAIAPNDIVLYQWSFTNNPIYVTIDAY